MSFLGVFSSFPGLKNSGIKFGHRHAEGYTCTNFVVPTLRVTPELFLPEDMCTCQKGYSGRGASCEANAPAQVYSLQVPHAAACER